MSLVAERAWAFALDGHIFYVINDVEGKSYLYDVRTGQWAVWYTGEESSTWNFQKGHTWRSRTIALEEDSDRILELDPYSERDVDDQEIRRVVTAFQTARGDDAYRQGSMRVNASVGAPTVDETAVEMRFSNDGGVTWVGPFAVSLLLAEWSQRIEFRSLGRIRAPGRLWEIRDVGGLMRIDGCDQTVELPGEEEENGG